MKIYLRDILIAMTLVFVGATIVIIVNKDNKKDYSNVKIIDNSTQYYSVSAIVDKYIHYLNEKNKDKIIDMLDINYKENNHINKNNVLKNLKSSSDSNISFLGDIMYYEELNENLDKVYVSGFIQRVSLDSFEVVGNFYIIVLMDKDNNTFSIIPDDDGKQFKEVEKWSQN